MLQFVKINKGLKIGICPNTGPGYAWKNYLRYWPSSGEIWNPSSSCKYTKITEKRIENGEII